MNAWVSHPTGNANVRAVLDGLRRADQLGAYWTTLGLSRGSPLLRLAPRRLAATLGRRAYDLPPGLLRAWPWPELARLGLPRGRGAAAARDAVDAVYRALDARVARALARSRPRDLPAVAYGYEDGCSATFAEARRRGVATAYDLPIGYWRAGAEVFAREAALNPAWASTLGGLGEPEDKLARKDLELAGADVVLVASSFTARTLARFPGRVPAVRVIPYGAPRPAATPPAPRPRGAPLRAIFVGGLSQRKGLSYLFDAAERLRGRVELTVVGRRPEGCPALDAALARCTHVPSLPHAELIALLGRHDVLVFPSLFEGFGLVIVEALSQGLAVITTPCTAGPDLLADGGEGWIVPEADATALERALGRLAADDDLLRAMQERALARAAELSWTAYGDAVAAEVRRLAGRRGEEAR